MKTEVVNNGRTFEPQNLENVQLSVDTSLTGRALDVDTATFDISTGEGRQLFLTNFPRFFFTRDNLLFNANDSFDFSWDQASPIQLKRGGSQYGIFFPRSAARYKTNAYSLSCTSALGKLSQMPHLGGIYTGNTGTHQKTAGDLIREICGYTGSTPGAVTVYISPVFESTPVYGWLPMVSPSGEDGAQYGSAKDNLMQVCFYLNAAVHDDENGVLRIENLDTQVKSDIIADRIYRNNAKVIDEIPVTAISLLEHQWIEGTESEVLFEGTTSAGQKIVFREPHHNLSATGFSITSSGANYAILSAGTGTLTGIPYTHITREHTIAVSASDTENVEHIEEAWLVDSFSAPDILNHLKAYYQCQKTIRVQAIIDFEDAGDVINIWDPFDKVMRQACIESIAPIELSNVARGLISARVGYTPYQVERFENEHIIIDQAYIAQHGDSFVFPNNLPDGTEVTLVLIGGGQGGRNGKAGHAGDSTAEKHTWIGTGMTRTLTISAQNGGNGGSGGTHGNGGKIWRGTITVNHNQSFSLVVGSGGSSNGGAGGNTTFGAYSSANGSTSDAGYADAIAGITFALPGVDGISGENGARGDTGNISSTSESTTGSLGAGGRGGSSGSTAGTNGHTEYTTGPSSEPGGYYRWDSYGGKGANAIASKPQKTVYGCGGDGGNGGGGGGGCGGGSWTWNYTAYGPDHDMYLGGTGGSGGLGGAGGAGAPGCMILTYRRPQTQ